MCSETQFDIIFMDIHMPNVNGLEATNYIRYLYLDPYLTGRIDFISFHHQCRNTNNKNVYTPIIAFTSSGSLEEYKMYGVQDMLQKPFTQETLSDMFDRWTPFTKGESQCTHFVS